MTELLAPVLRRGSAGPERARRPLALDAALAGVAAPALALLLGWAVGLVAWFANDGGSHGTTRSVLRIAADAWLLAHGAHLDLGGSVVVTASPLGLTLACGWLAYRFGRWAGASSEVEDLRSAGLAAVVLAGSYGLVGLLVALLASTPTASAGLGLAFLCSAAVAAVAGGLGIVRGAGLLGALRAALPADLLAAAYAAAVVVVGMVAAGALLTTVAVAVRGAAVANVAEELHLDVVGLIFAVLLTVALAPNAALLAGSYLLGPGFAVGADSVVAPQEVTLGAVPLVPVLGALPPEGWTPAWALLLLGVPLAVGAVAGHVAVRLQPTSSFQAATIRGLVGAVLGAGLLAVLTSQAGGAIGPGRMAETGAAFLPVLLAALVALTPAAVLGAVGAAWRDRPRKVAAHEPAEQPEPEQPHRQVTSRASVPGQRSPSRRATVRLPGQRRAGAAGEEPAQEATQANPDEDTVRVAVRRGKPPSEG